MKTQTCFQNMSRSYLPWALRHYLIFNQNVISLYFYFGVKYDQDILLTGIVRLTL